jgi:predicted YcjX-like family ATPase
VFPGDLPDDPKDLFDPAGAGFRGLTAAEAADADYRFLRFRPPPREPLSRGASPRESWEGRLPVLPHIRLDRALQFLLGDRLR